MSILHLYYDVHDACENLNNLDDVNQLALFCNVTNSQNVPCGINRNHYLFNTYERAYSYLYGVENPNEEVPLSELEKVLTRAENQLITKLNPFVLAKRKAGIFNKELGITKQQDRKGTYTASLLSVRDQLVKARDYFADKIGSSVPLYYEYGQFVKDANVNISAVNNVIRKRDPELYQDEILSKQEGME